MDIHVSSTCMHFLRNAYDNEQRGFREFLLASSGAAHLHYRASPILHFTPLYPRIDRPIVPVADAVFLIGGDRDQDDVELFQELWRKHRGGKQDAPNGFDNVAPPLPSRAIRASNIVPP